LSELTGGSIDLTKDDKTGIATVLLNNLEIKNAFSGKMMVDFADAVSELENWQEGRGVIVRGAGGTFCSGGDLNLMKNILTPSKGGDLSRFMQDTLMRLFCLPLVTVAFVEGRALGGGAELLTACDFRIFAKSASFGFVQSKLGVTTGWGGGVRLVELVGRTTALRLLSGGEVMSSCEARDVGLADGVVKDGEEGMEQVMKIIHRLVSSAASPLVVQTAKKVVLNALSAGDVTQRLDCERQLFETVWGGPAHLDALKGSAKFVDSKS
jgi:ethylmalonyl-CoA/methylmalonyl-CoA decarboxylase